MYGTTTRLADGRELRYFDAEPGRVPPPDTRDIEPVVGVGEIRYDALFDEYVTVAGHRMTRTFLPTGGAATCPLCPSTPDNLTEIPAPAYEVAIFENRFPSLAAPPEGWRLPLQHIGAKSANAGRCEVVCFTDEHDSSFAELTPERARLVLDALAERTAALNALDYVEYVFAFENCGAEIGVTISHPHGQIYAYPFVPPRAQALLEASRRHEQATGSHLIQDIIDAELADRSRVIEETEHWVAFVPFAARWPYQVQLHPRRHVADLTELTDDERDDLAALYLRTLRRLNGLFGVKMPYIAAWHQAPKGELRRYGRLHLDLFSARREREKLKYLAGSEAAMGAFISDIAPELAAERLRAVEVE